MTQSIVDNLSTTINRDIADDLVNSYIALATKFRKNDLEGCLSSSGKFVENTLRAIEFIRTGKTLTEIKNAARTKVAIENDTSLSESLRLLVPRVSQAMIYDIRSKTGAVHVKEIDPRPIDAALAVQAASWVMAELLRLYHNSDEASVEAEMAALMRTHTPFIETFGDESVVTRIVKAELEILLLLANRQGGGLSRQEIGFASKYKPSTITNTLVKLSDSRYIHQTADRRYHITGPGERRTSDLLLKLDR